MARKKPTKKAAPKRAASPRRKPASRRKKPVPIPAGVYNATITNVVEKKASDDKKENWAEVAHSCVGIVEGEFIRRTEEPGRVSMTQATFEKLAKHYHPSLVGCDLKALKQPHFTLLAQDNFTPVLLQSWIELAGEHGATDEKILGATILLKKIEEWRRQHPLALKSPD